MGEVFLLDIPFFRTRLPDEWSPGTQVTGNPAYQGLRLILSVLKDRCDL